MKSTDTEYYNTYFKAVKLISIYSFIFLLLLPAILFLTGQAIDSALLHFVSIHREWSLIGWIVTGLGAFIMISSMLQLIIAGKGLPISHLPPTKFVTSGFYSISRHPIYLGFNLLVLGCSLLLQSAGTLLVSVPLLFVGTICYIHFFEEPVLQNRFGKSYSVYQDEVPALLPIYLPKSLDKLKESLQKYLQVFFTKLANNTILFKYHDLIFVNYGLLSSIGIILFMQYCAALLIAQGLTIIQTALFIIGCGLSGVAGARIYWWIEHIKILIHEPWFGFLKVGFVSWGVILGLLFFLIPFAYITGYTLILLTDVIFGGMFIGYALGRIGCLTYGCCYGKITDSGGITYYSDQAKVNRLKGTHGESRYPTQLFSSAHGLVLFILLNYLISLEWTAGIVTIFALIYYGIGRSYEEFYRDRSRIRGCIFTEGHLGSFAFIITGILLATFIPLDGPFINAITFCAAKESLVLTPYILMLGFLLFLILAYHRKQIGKW